MAKYLYCHGNTTHAATLPPLGEPVVCIFRQRKGDKVVGVKGIAVCMQDLYSDSFYWVRMNAQESKCAPFAWLDMEGESELSEQALHNLSTLGELKL